MRQVKDLQSLMNAVRQLLGTAYNASVNATRCFTSELFRCFWDHAEESPTCSRIFCCLLWNSEYHEVLCVFHSYSKDLPTIVCTGAIAHGLESTSTTKHHVPVASGRKN